ncbi:MAG TPA: PAS domain S-box protein [Candidatus Polarisedimenticolia bacterium]|nr:PAS domain S-box protein [Candidatus Polarisedimenticolia bacterium]
MTPTPRGAEALAGPPATQQPTDAWILARLAEILRSDLPLEEILQRLLRSLAQALDVQRAELYMIDQRARMLVGRQAVILDDDQQAAPAIAGTRLPLTGIPDVMSAAVLARTTHILEDLGASTGGLGLSAAVRDRFPSGSFAAVPVVAWGQVVAVIALHDPRRGRPLQPRLPMIDLLAAHTGLALERAQLRDDRDKSEREIANLRQFIERSPDGIVESSLDGRILSCNERILRLLGYSREELLAMKAQDIYVSTSSRDELVRLVREQGQVEAFEVAVRRKDGSAAFVSVSTRLRCGSGEPVMESIVRDVTERREVERRMRMLMDVVNYSADAILSLDTEGKVTSWNVGAQAILGHASEEMLGRHYETLVPADLLQEFRTVIRPRAEKEGHLQAYQTERLHKDGRRIPVSITVTRLRHNGGPDLGWSVVVRDISERRKEEQRRRLLSSITEQSPDAILSADGQGRITSWNKGAEKIFGYRDEEIVGRPWLVLAPPDREAEFRAVAGAAPQGQESEAPRSIDTVARTADGRLLPVRLSASVLYGPGLQDVGWSIILRDLSEQASLAEMSERLREELFIRNRLEGIVGHSRAMEEVRERVRRVARFNSSVLLMGQSGTGKEVVANAIHYNSPRRDKPFIKVNCAAIPEHLLESELFGIDRNVATGVDSRIGRFEMADGGTLFLDEIADMTLSTQAKILRVLQEREFERVGGKKVIKVDVRIVAATNKDLEAEIRERRFRDDLYYRLNVILVNLPPLAERREDIDPLIDHFLDRFARDNGLPRKRFSLPARLLLNEYDWPGNVRELEHCIERATVMAEGQEIGEADLPPSILIWKEMGGARAGAEAGQGGLSQILRQVERRAVRDALERSGWVQARAARLLGISERSMWYRVKKLGLQNPEP